MALRKPHDHLRPVAVGGMLRRLYGKRAVELTGSVRMEVFSFAQDGWYLYFQHVWVLWKVNLAEPQGDIMNSAEWADFGQC